MRFSLLLALLLLGACTVLAVNPAVIPREASNSQSKTAATRTRSATKSFTPTNIASKTNSATRTATSTPHPTQSSSSSSSGLSTGAKIGIGVGVPLGVLAIAGAVAAYIIGRRRGRKRRVDDPTAGAGKNIRDPSEELNLSPNESDQPPVAELPATGTTQLTSPKTGWWKPNFGSVRSTKKGEYAHAPGSPPPQEMPA